MTLKIGKMEKIEKLRKIGEIGEIGEIEGDWNCFLSTNKKRFSDSAK